jgi:hypothetical protein
MSDTVPSLPGPPQRPVQIELGTGFVFTTGGIAHSITQAEMDDLVSGLFGPNDPSLGSPPDG